MEELTIYDMVSLLKRRRKIIISLPIILIILVGLVSSYLLSPVYSSSTTIMVGEARLAYSYLSLIQDRETYKELVKNLDLDIDYNSWRENLRVELVKDPEIIEIEVRNKNPELAASIANETSQVFLERSKEFLDRRVQIIDGVEVIEDDLEARLISKAEVAREPVNLGPREAMVLAGILGLILGIFLAFLLEFLDRTIKSPKDVARYINLPVIANIGKEEKAGYDRLVTSIKYARPSQGLKFLALLPASPTSRKANLPIKLARALARRNGKVLLIDCDLRRPRIHRQLGLDNSPGLSDILLGRELVDKGIRRLKNENFYLLAAGPKIDDPVKYLDSDKMFQLIDDMEEFDLVILSLPPLGLVTDSLILSLMVDKVVLTVGLGRVDREELVDNKELLNRLGASILGLVLYKE